MVLILFVFICCVLCLLMGFRLFVKKEFSRLVLLIFLSGFLEICENVLLLKLVKYWRKLLGVEWYCCKLLGGGGLRFGGGGLFMVGWKVFMVFVKDVFNVLFLVFSIYFLFFVNDYCGGKVLVVFWYEGVFGLLFCIFFVL